MTSTPHWLTHYETTTGAPARLAASRAVPHTCPTCRRLTLRGLDAPLIAALATIDPYTATPTQETAAVLLAIPTYRLWGHPGTWTLTPRHHPADPAPTWTLPTADHVPVVIAHTCHPPLATRPLDHHQPTTRHDNPPY